MIRLYDTVLVQHEDYQHFGEVFSRPTPTSTIMVRMVPGHPGTLKEMHICKVKESRERLRWVHYAEVYGPGYFPIDMLRRDNAAPVNFDPQTMHIDESFGFAFLCVAYASPLRKPHWNKLRWHSFGWSLKEAATVPYVPGSVD